MLSGCAGSPPRHAARQSWSELGGEPRGERRTWWSPAGTATPARSSACSAVCRVMMCRSQMRHSTMPRPPLTCREGSGSESARSPRPAGASARCPAAARPSDARQLRRWVVLREGGAAATTAAASMSLFPQIIRHPRSAHTLMRQQGGPGARIADGSRDRRRAHGNLPGALSARRLYSTVNAPNDRSTRLILNDAPDVPAKLATPEAAQIAF